MEYHLSYEIKIYSWQVTNARIRQILWRVPSLHFSCSRQFVLSPITATELETMDNFIKLESTPVNC